MAIDWTIWLFVSGIIIGFVPGYYLGRYRQKELENGK